MSKKLRLLLFETCNRACSGCNKDWNIKSLPICETTDGWISGWDKIFLTGGEPLLNPDMILKVVTQIPASTRVVLYTAKVDDLEKFIPLLGHLDGLTLTLHEQGDVGPFLALNNLLMKNVLCPWSLRLNVFKGVELPEMEFPLWKIKPEMEWIKDCPPPVR